MNILSLYHSIVRPIFDEWIGDDDLCCMDSAVCNQELRNNFLCTLTQCNIGYDNITGQYLQWVILRGISLGKVCLNDSWLSLFPQLQRCVPRNKRLRYLKAPATPNLRRLLEMIWSVEILVLCGPTSCVNVEMILSCMIPSDHLDVSRCTGLKKGLMSLITTLCPNLKRVTVPARFDVSEVLDKCKNLADISCGVKSSFINSFCDEKISNESVCVIRCRVKGSSPLTKLDGDKSIDSLFLITTKQCSIHFGNSTLRSTRYLKLKSSSSVSYRGNLKTTIIHAFGMDLSGCLCLTCLDLSNSRFFERSFVVSIESLISLRVVDLDNCVDVTDASFLRMSKYCLSLEVAKANGTKVTDFGAMKLLENCIDLRTICLQKTECTDATLIFAAQKTEFIQLESETLVVRRLNSRSTVRIAFLGITAANLCSVFKDCPGLLMCKLISLNKVYDAVVDCLVKSCPLLHTLSVENCFVTNDVFSILTRTAKLTAVTVKHLIRVSDKHIEDFLRSNSGIRMLSLAGCSGFTANVLSIVARHCPSIRHIDMSGCKVISDVDVEDLLSDCPCLLYLNVAGCPLVTSEGLSNIKYPRLKIDWVEYKGVEKDMEYNVDNDPSDYEDDDCEVEEEDENVE